MELIAEELGAVDRVDTLSDRSYSKLRRALMAGAFSPGQKVTIREISAALGVSLTPARDAIGRLVAEHALESGANRTVYVPELTEERTTEIYRIRIALEAMAAEAAVPLITDAIIAQMEKLQEAIGTAMDAKDYKTVLRENERFHFMLYETSGMTILCNTIEHIWLQIGPSFNFLYPEFEKNRKGVSAHRALLAGLKRRDAAAVRAAVELDLRGGEERLLRVIASNRSKKPRAKA